MSTASTHGPTSLYDMAEEIFGLSVMTWRERLAAKHEAEAEMSESQFLTLDLLARNSPLTVGELQRAIGVLPAQMSRIIRSLETGFEKPLIHCELNQTDKRKIDVSLTALGRRHYDAFRQLRLARIQETLARLSESDRVEFVRICRQIRDLSKPAGAEKGSEPAAGA